MAKQSAISKQDFINKIYETFPDTRNTNTVSRAQIMELTTYIPAWLNAMKMSRGLYALPGGKQATTAAVATEATAPVFVPTAPTVDNVSTLVPAKDHTFVPFGNYANVETIIKSGIFYPTFITGPSGNGKSTMVEQACAKHKRPLIRINLNMMSDEDQLIGSKTLENGDIKIVEGPVLIAMRTGSVLLLDELDAGSANTLLCLQPILEGKPYYFKLKNEVIVPTAGFNIIATGNTKGKGSEDGRYIGTNVLNEAFLERFAVTFEQEYPSATVETKIVHNIMNQYNCLDYEFAAELVKWADAIRRTFDDGGVDDTITTRRVGHIIRAFAIFKDKRLAVQLCCNRFDVNTKDAFNNLFDKVCSPENISGPTTSSTMLPE